MWLNVVELGAWGPLQDQFGHRGGPHVQTEKEEGKLHGPNLDRPPPKMEPQNLGKQGRGDFPPPPPRNGNCRILGVPGERKTEARQRWLVLFLFFADMVQFGFRASPGTGPRLQVFSKMILCFRLVHIYIYILYYIYYKYIYIFGIYEFSVPQMCAKKVDGHGVWTSATSHRAPLNVRGAVANEIRQTPIGRHFLRMAFHENQRQHLIPEPSRDR